VPKHLCSKQMAVTLLEAVDALRNKKTFFMQASVKE
jgi:hypothetical protein